MLVDPTRTYDGFLSLLGGVDGGHEPEDLRPDQVVKAINVSFRGSRPGPRPGIERVTLSYDGASTAHTFQVGRFQGAAVHRSMTRTQMVCSVDGRIFAIIMDTSRGNSGKVLDVTPPGDPNSNETLQVFFCQAGRFLVIQDGINLPILFDGNECRRAADSGEVPIGTVMTYGLGRLWVARGNTFVAGDLSGSDEDSEIKFTENLYLNEGGSFPFPPDLGTLRAMIFPPIQDTTTGQGELLVFGDYGAITVFASVPRDQWKDVQIQRVVLRNYGAVGARALTSVNGDVIYPAHDGVRSYRMARAEQQGWGQTPISSEVRGYLEIAAPDLLPLVRTALFDNRWYCTVLPEPCAPGSIRHRGMLVIDFDPVSGLQRKTAPAWEGLWTGVFPLDLVTGNFDGTEHLFIFSADNDQRNRLYQMSRTAKADVDDQPIPWSIETRSYSFETPFAEKELYAGDMWFTEIWGTAEVEVKWRPDGFHCWADWSTRTLCALRNTLEVNPATGLNSKLFRTIPDLTGVSGATYNARSGTIFLIKNDGGAGTIWEVSLVGDVLRTITPSNFVDTEAIEWMGYDTANSADVFMIAEENNNQRLSLCRLTPAATTLNRTASGNVSTTTIYSGGTINNLGLESACYDANRGVIYYTIEKRTESGTPSAPGSSDAGIYTRPVTVSGTLAFGTETLLTSVAHLFSRGTLTDISDMAYDAVADNLLILSHESDKIVRMSRSGTVLESFTITFTEAEGLAINPTSTRWYVAGEPNEFAQYNYGGPPNPSAVACYLPNPKPQHRARVRLPSPPDTPHPVTNNLLKRGMCFQLKIEVTGYTKLAKLRLHASTLVEETTSAPDVDTCAMLDCGGATLVGLTGCDDDLIHVIDAPTVRGCTNPNATNYNSAATEDDGTCEFDSGIGAVGGSLL